MRLKVCAKVTIFIDNGNKPSLKFSLWYKNKQGTMLVKPPAYD